MFCMNENQLDNQTEISQYYNVASGIWMPATQLYYYEENGEVPVYQWLKELGRTDKKALANCLAKIRLLAFEGHQLRRPHTDYLRGGIYELRAKRGRVQYRILYFFHGQNIALLTHGLTKEKKVPSIDIERAIRRKKQYEKSPETHRAEIEVEEIL